MLIVNIARETGDKSTTSIRMSRPLRSRLSAISEESGVNMTNLVATALWDLVDKYEASLDNHSNR